MKKVFNVLQKNMFIIIIAIVGGAYILTGLSNIAETGESINTIIANSALATILGWLISGLFGQQAIVDSFNDTDMIRAYNTLEEEITKIDGDINKLDIFCEKDNEQTMIRKRNRLLKKVGLKIDFLDNFNKDKLKDLTKRQKKAVNKALNIGYGYITSDWLLSDIEEQEERNNKPLNIQKYSAKKNVSNLIGKTITGIISGLYILEPFANANWNIVIWRLFFFATWLIFGYVRYMSDFNFITKNYRKTIILKANKIISFRTSLIENADWYMIEEPIKTSPEVVINDLSSNTHLEKDKTLTNNQEIITPYHTSDLIRID